MSDKPKNTGPDQPPKVVPVEGGAAPKLPNANKIAAAVNDIWAYLTERNFTVQEYNVTLNLLTKRLQEQTKIGR